MRRSTVAAFALGVVSSTFLAAMLTAQPATAEDRSDVVIPGIELEIAREPVLIFDQTGGTLVGPVHQNLIVYSDGLMAYSLANNVVIPGGGEFIDARIAFHPDVDQLIKDLGAAGAGTLQDGGFFVVDAPVNTVSFFRSPGTNARGNTFSYFGGTEYAATSEIIFDTINSFFPLEDPIPLPLPGEG